MESISDNRIHGNQLIIISSQKKYEDFADDEVGFSKLLRSYHHSHHHHHPGCYEEECAITRMIMMQMTNGNGTTSAFPPGSSTSQSTSLLSPPSSSEPSFSRCHYHDDHKLCIPNEMNHHNGTKRLLLQKNLPVTKRPKKGIILSF